MRLFLLLLLISSIGMSQELPKGYRLLKFNYQGDQVDVLVICESGEEDIKKPLFFFLQGSLARPIGTKSDRGYQPFLPPFKTDSIRKKYHIIILSKAFVPPFVSPEELNDQYVYLDQNGKVSKEFLTRDHLDYYVDRNNYILNQLLKENWVDKNKIVLSGHSQGSSVGAFMSKDNNLITHLIYASGNPYGRILSTLGQIRADEDTLTYTSGTFKKFEDAVNNPEEDFNEQGDSNKSVFTFNQKSDQILLNLNIPTLIVYGSKDKNTPYIDLLHIEAIRSGNQYLNFKEYTGTEHNFFPVDREGNVNYTVNNWNKVAQYWFDWLEQN